ncbi:alpha-(1,3)-fucosyltransferase C-like [Daphnia pulicaria]|uniref:alpha-(1,3)-fucosyltransferase C-like n=1 Tax=Daphnia pulicaria TaxID=35523 RepID=UPI001EEB676F|nr:alpha-(1,3)-fucosyltransferase C-like [Daphnia pulicaria]
MSHLNTTFSPPKGFTLILLIWYLIVLCYCLYKRELVVETDQLERVGNSEFLQKNVTKTILLWNGVRRKEVRIFGTGNQIFAKQNCPVNRCEIVTNRTERPIESYDAIIVVFHNEFITPYELMMPEFPNGRSPNLRLVFLTQEPPTSLKPHYNTSQLTNFFNWTMTYRIDSDIPFLYGRVLPKETAPRTTEEVAHYREMAKKISKPLQESQLRNKTKTIAWMVSHCKTHGQREKYVEELRKYMDVDIYGSCGNGKFFCQRHGTYFSEPQCNKVIESTYKFYLSFENSFCKDYVTEKFFKILDLYMIPIVYGGADYTQHAPPHSYIDALKYKPKELAAYLKILDADNALYNEYFWWKDHYRVEFISEYTSRHGFCGLCQKLHDIQTQFKSFSDQRVISDLGDDSKCQPIDPNLIA